MEEQLPIKNIFIRGIKMPFERYKALIRLGWPFALLTLAWSLVPEDVNSIPLHFVYYTLSGLTCVLAMVRCHKVFLLPQQLIRETQTLRWSYAESNFLLSTILLGLLYFLVVLPVFLVIFNIAEMTFFEGESHEVLMGIIFALLLLPVYYFVSRWSLILPGSAVGGKVGLSWSWHASSAYSFRLFILIGATPFITDIFLAFFTVFFALVAIIFKF